MYKRQGGDPNAGVGAGEYAEGYWSQWKTWCRLRALEGKGPWLVEGDGVDAAVKELTKFMALRCFTFKKQSQIVRGYLAAVSIFTKCSEDGNCPLHTAMVTAVGKGIDRAHGKSDVRPEVRKPPLGDLLTKKRKSVAEVDTEGWVDWIGLALLFKLLCRA